MVLCVCYIQIVPDDLGRAAGTSDAPQFVSFGSAKPPGLIQCMSTSCTVYNILHRDSTIHAACTHFRLVYSGVASGVLKVYTVMW